MSINIVAGQGSSRKQNGRLRALREMVFVAESDDDAEVLAELYNQLVIDKMVMSVQLTQEQILARQYGGTREQKFARLDREVKKLIARKDRGVG